MKKTRMALRKRHAYDRRRTSTVTPIVVVVIVVDDGGARRYIVVVVIVVVIVCKVHPSSAGYPYFMHDQTLGERDTHMHNDSRHDLKTRPVVKTSEVLG